MAGLATTNQCSLYVFTGFHFYFSLFSDYYYYYYYYYYSCLILFPFFSSFPLFFFFFFLFPFSSSSSSTTSSRYAFSPLSTYLSELTLPILSIRVFFCMYRAYLGLFFFPFFFFSFCWRDRSHYPFSASPFLSHS